MAKSTGNEFILSDIEERGIDPLSFRYLCMTVRYRHRMNFTLSALKGAEQALTRLRDIVWSWRNTASDPSHGVESNQWRALFQGQVHKDLNLPNAMRVTWDMLRSNLDQATKLSLLLEFDAIFGLGLEDVPATYPLPRNVAAAINNRNDLRKNGDFTVADSLRSSLTAKGYSVRDTETHTLVRPTLHRKGTKNRWKEVSSSNEVANNLTTPDQLDFSFVITSNGYLVDLQRCARSILKWVGPRSIETIIVINGSTNEMSSWAERFSCQHPNVKAFHCDHFIGEAAAKNLGIKSSLGRNVILLDPSVELSGDPTATIDSWLRDDGIGIVGPWGLRSPDLQHFDEEIYSGEADAMQGYCIAFRRSLCVAIGLTRECFRFYRNLDIDFSFQTKAHGYRIVADGNLPLRRHEHRQWNAIGNAERDELSFKNFKRFLKRWGDRKDLLISKREAMTEPHRR